MLTVLLPLFIAYVGVCWYLLSKRTRSYFYAFERLFFLSLVALIGGGSWCAGVMRGAILVSEQPIGSIVTFYRMAIYWIAGSVFVACVAAWAILRVHDKEEQTRK